MIGQVRDLWKVVLMEIVLYKEKEWLLPKSIIKESLEDININLANKTFYKSIPISIRDLNLQVKY